MALIVNYPQRAQDGSFFWPHHKHPQTAHNGSFSSFYPTMMPKLFLSNINQTDSTLLLPAAKFPENAHMVKLSCYAIWMCDVQK